MARNGRINEENMYKKVENGFLDLPVTNEEMICEAEWKGCEGCYKKDDCSVDIYECDKLVSTEKCICWQYAEWGIPIGILLNIPENKLSYKVRMHDINSIPAVKFFEDKHDVMPHLEMIYEPNSLMSAYTNGTADIKEICGVPEDIDFNDEVKEECLRYLNDCYPDGDNVLFNGAKDFTVGELLNAIIKLKRPMCMSIVDYCTESTGAEGGIGCMFFDDETQTAIFTELQEEMKYRLYQETYHSIEDNDELDSIVEKYINELLASAREEDIK